jgi:hypothetical protein
MIRKNTNTMTEARRQQIEAAADEVMAELGLDEEEINDGYCPYFATKLVDRVGGVIVDALADEMKPILEGYTTQAPTDLEPELSHCWVYVDGMYFDAEAADGRYEEYNLPIFQ